MNSSHQQLLDFYHHLWELHPVEPPNYTASSILQKVIYKQHKAMLKIPTDAQEKSASELLLLLAQHDIAVKVYAHHQGVLLLQYIPTTHPTVYKMALDPLDPLPTKIISTVAQKIASVAVTQKLPLTLLSDYFASLTNASHLGYPILQQGATLAKKLLCSPTKAVILHGDLHHQNILIDQHNTPLCIDPKALYGHAIFDYLPLLCNPTKHIATQKERFYTHVDLIAQYTQFPKKLIFEWAFVYATLSASWFIEDALDPSTPLEIAHLAKPHLSK